MVQNVVIIGAGPAGLLLAHYLLRRDNYHIDIYERRPDLRLTDVSVNRTFPLSLQERGRKAIRAIVGLEEAIAAQSVFCQGTIIYQKKGKARRVPRQTPILTIDRNRLVTILLKQLTETSSPNQVKVHFNSECTAVDGTAKTVTLKPLEGDSFTVHYDLLVGADGARSQIREYLVENAGLPCSQNYVLDAYKSVFLSRLNPNAGVELDPNKIHAWNLNNKTRMVMVPQPENQLNGVIIFDPQTNPLEGLSTKEEVKAFFLENFPLFGQLMSLEEAEALLKRPVARLLTVRCDRFHEGDSVLLIGDSAHAVSPAVGQGCNSSLEDVLILGQLLEQYGDDWRKVLPQFSEQRVPDAHALQELSDYSFPRTKLLVVEFFLRLTLGRLFHRWFPGLVQPFVFDLLLDTDLPYSQVLSLNQGWIHKVKRSIVENF
ncbi:NAD(P)/FAD-dependent oxidoreductase [Coleofasciculus sp. FACHB-1120]|uniref:FAD-dependent oxidoreductase n=1 Tax=Coleofasciculus sp. FACHB-1120 TaxID=2692783 RepID=UPI00168400F4|nr:NAD(P)/FAD-dependent oxidoreductase [Coleofasciculus sp. FACHB-1120]MBD2744814.1 FAD-dependent monooxygenase [Coleofasciculus sp. FACHB-1120]